jgi:hypothetical protein
MKKVTITTTLEKLRAHNACTDGYRKLVKSLGVKYPATKPINLLTILKSNGVDDMCWCFRATTENCDKVARLIAADFAEAVLHLFTKEHPNDDRPAKAIQAARDFANGKIDDTAWTAAWAAVGAVVGAAAGATAGDAA